MYIYAIQCSIPEHRLRFLCSFVDANNIAWVGDDPYIKSGEKETVPNVDNSVDRPFKTRRVFRSRKKNCYSIDVGKGESVLLRAHFYYGTYTDETFDL
uniref:Malectin-like domain-containing protein n=1 Tax=Nelumbo nucifera TaxID=4432 RepID=A0A822XHD1_NELNU|nr:TPA_asm: hypothetical protein HUJ06_021100 [Nelumbo nucifera]